jgi:ribosomal protein S13
MKKEIKPTYQNIIDFILELKMDTNRRLEKLEEKQMEELEQTYKQGYFCGREDLKIEIIADFNNK